MARPGDNAIHRFILQHAPPLPSCCWVSSHRHLVLMSLRLQSFISRVQWPMCSLFCYKLASMILLEQMAVKSDVRDCSWLWEGDWTVLKAEVGREGFGAWCSLQATLPWTSTVTFLMVPSPQHTNAHPLLEVAQPTGKWHTHLFSLLEPPRCQGINLMDFGIVTPINLAWSVRTASLKCVCFTTIPRAGIRIQSCWNLEGRWPQAEKSDCPVGHLGKKSKSLSVIYLIELHWITAE